MAQVDLFLSMPVYLYGLNRALGQRGLSVVGAKLSTSEGLSPHSDVVVADSAALHDGDATRLVSAVGDTVPVVLLVDDAHSGSSRRYLEAGVHVVVSLQSSVDDVVEAIHLAICSGLSNQFGETDGGHNTVAHDTAHALNRLSEREQQVLRQIVRGLTRGQIARALGISQHTVDTHVKRIKSKLTVDTKAALIRAALLGG
jgi:DNA-binding NarL/FixJ family response regulator